MKKVLVTGAFGNVGSFVLTQLLLHGYQVVAFDKPGAVTQKIAKRFAPRVQIVWGDIAQKEQLKDAFKGVDCVIHLAAIFPPLSETHQQLAQAVNITGTRHVIALMQESDRAKRLVFASSIGVYGKKQERFVPPLTVTTPANPDDYYGQTKIAGEDMIKSSSLEWTIMRLGACVPAKAINMGPFLKNSVLSFHPDCRVEAIHPADAALAFVNALDRPQSLGRTLLLGGGPRNQLTHQQLISAMLTSIGLHPLPREVFNHRGRKDYHGDWLDTEESQGLLQYQRHTVPQQFADFWASLGYARYLLPLLKPLAPLIHFVIKKQSPYYQSSFGG